MATTSVTLLQVNVQLKVSVAAAPLFPLNLYLTYIVPEDAPPNTFVIEAVLPSSVNPVALLSVPLKLFLSVFEYLTS